MDRKKKKKKRSPRLADMGHSDQDRLAVDSPPQAFIEQYADQLSCADTFT